MSLPDSDAASQCPEITGHPTSSDGGDRAAPLAVPISFAPLARENWTDEAREVFAFWGEPGAYENGSANNMVMTLAHHPALAIAYYTFGRHLLIASTLSARTRELIVLRVAWQLRSAYEWHYHVGYALNIEFDLEEIAAIGMGSTAVCWRDSDAAVLSAVEELLAQSRLSDGCRAALSRHFDAKQIIDLVFTIGNYVMLSWAISALDIKFEDSVDPIGFDLKTRSGVSPTRSYKPEEVDDWTSNRG